MLKIRTKWKTLSPSILLIHINLVIHLSLLSTASAQTNLNPVDQRPMPQRQLERKAIQVSAWIPADMETVIYTRAAAKDASYFERRMLETGTSFLSLVLPDRADEDAIRKQVAFSLRSAKNFKRITRIPESAAYDGLTILYFSQDIEEKFLELLEHKNSERLVSHGVAVRKFKLDAELTGAPFAYLAFPAANVALIANRETFLTEALQRSQQQAAHPKAEPVAWLHKVDSPLIAKRILRLGEGNQPDTVLQIKFNPQANACVFECSGDPQVIQDWKNSVNKAFRIAQLPELETKADKLGFQLTLDSSDPASERIYPKRANDVLMLTLVSLGHLFAL